MDSMIRTIVCACGYALTSTPLLAQNSGIDCGLPEVFSVMDMEDILGHNVIQVAGTDGTTAVFASALFIESSDLHFWDVSDPASPVELAQLVVPQSQLGGAGQIELDAGLLALSIAGEVHVVDYSDPTQPAAESTIGSGVDAIAMDGTVLYVGAGQQIDAYDISVPASPTLLGTIGLGTGVGALETQGDLLFVGRADATIETFDVSNRAVRSRFRACPSPVRRLRSRRLLTSPPVC